MHTSAQKIVSWYASKPAELRGHLGCSELGKECKRALWYSFRWASPKHFEGRILRLFDTGHREEPRMLHELRSIGAEVYDKDPDTKQQHRFVGYKGHLAGSCDAIGRGLPEAPKTWAVIEFKTHGDKSFKELLAKGVAQHKPEHFAQVQLYMGLAELKRALYLACNKNTDELYSEWIEFDNKAFAQLQVKAAQVIDAGEPLQRIHEDPAWYQCKMCDHHAVCHTEQIAQKSCRTCVHSTPVEEGAWSCSMHGSMLSLDEQHAACGEHLMIPALIKWAEPIDAGADYVTYRDRKTGMIFANVAESNDPSTLPADVAIRLTSAELPVTVRAIANDTTMQQLKEQFPTARIATSSNIQSTASV